MLRWLRSLAIGMAVGLVVGVVVGGSLGRVFMRLAFLAEKDALLIVGSVALTAVPVPILTERLAPDRQRQPGHLATAAVAFGMIGFVLFAITGIVIAYTP